MLFRKTAAKTAEFRQLLEIVTDDTATIRRRLNAVRKFRGQFSPDNDLGILERILFIPDVSLPTKAFIVNVLGVIGNDNAFLSLMRIIVTSSMPGELKFQAYKHMLRLNIATTRKVVNLEKCDWIPKLRLVRATDTPEPNSPGFSGGVHESIIEVLIGSLFDEIPDDEEDVKA